MSRDTTLVPVQVPDLNSASGYRIAWLPANTPTPDTSAGEREMVQQSIATKQSTDATGNSASETANGEACQRCGSALGRRPIFLGKGDEGHICDTCWRNDRFDEEYQAAGKRPVPSVSGNTNREQQRDTTGVTAGETAPNSPAVAETRRTALDDNGLLHGISSDPPSSPGERMREALADFATSAAFASRGALDSDTVFCEIYTPGYQPQKKGSFGFYVKDLRNLLALAALALQGPSGKTPGAVDE